jgi:hypothetical protein
MTYSLGLLFDAWKAGASIAVISDMHHWWLWSIGKLLGIQIVPSLHCAFWPSGFRQRKMSNRVFDSLNYCFWRFVPKRTICISPEFQRQLKELGGQLAFERAVQGRAHYRRELFENTIGFYANT